ncbi:hypothetical protein Tco_0716699 [Tanacetum coccineum]
MELDFTVFSWLKLEEHFLLPNFSTVELVLNEPNNQCLNTGFNNWSHSRKEIRPRSLALCELALAGVASPSVSTTAQPNCSSYQSEPRQLLQPSPASALEATLSEQSDEVFSTWMTFGGNTRDLGSFGEETDKITDLHQIHEEVLFTERGDGVAGIKRRRRDLSSDGVRDLVTASGRGRLKEDLE